MLKVSKDIKIWEGYVLAIDAELQLSQPEERAGESQQEWRMTAPCPACKERQDQRQQPGKSAHHVPVHHVSGDPPLHQQLLIVLQQAHHLQDLGVVWQTTQVHPKRNFEVCLLNIFVVISAGFL